MVQESIEQHGNHASTQYNLALCYIKMDEGAKAMFSLHRCVNSVARMTKSVLSMLFCCASTLVMNPNHRKAASWLKRLLRVTLVVHVSHSS